MNAFLESIDICDTIYDVSEMHKCAINLIVILVFGLLQKLAPYSSIFWLKITRIPNN